MPPNFEQSKDQIALRVQQFTTNRDAYRGPNYKEAQARQEFIDPFFSALGWDVGNAQRAAPDYREVVFEDSVEIEGQKKAPDYVFRVGRERKFFVEAKKPGVDLKNAAAPAYQLRRYAWTAKLPLSVLTDFEELATYDCRSRPSASDKPSVARVSYFTYTEYADRWREIWDVYSREAVWGGSFDQFAQTSKGKRGTSEVDKEFLKEIEGWREALARNMALRNPSLGIDELNDAVQRTIDRIIFLRLTEDRGIEDYGRLRRLAEGEDIYDGLVKLFRHADAKYNSGLFDFSREGDRLTPHLTVDDKTLKPILADLYFPQSPYEFSVLPVEILGNVYEQFLGKVIRLTAAHQAKVEEKPEVKKAGGVYYTPAYIVKYIVQNTVGKLVEGKSPLQLRGFRVLDAACGSGSFLLGAYQYLLDYYQDWYNANAPEKYPRAVWQAGDVWRLTGPEKKRILTEHIFGVDIDRQAVEVTKLSLLLAVLESETGTGQSKQLALMPEQAKERVLPNLDRNIKCGNSLIGPDYFTGQLLPDEAELRRVNPFDWKAEFPDVMKAGGFECVIGNPPWLMAGYYIENGLGHLREKFVSAQGKFDLYYLFIEQGTRLMSNDGQFGMIVPNKFFHTKAATKLRNFLDKPKWIRRIVDFGDAQVFVNATNYSCILFLQKQPVAIPSYAKAEVGLAITTDIDLPWSVFAEDPWHFEAQGPRALFSKMEHAGQPLDSLTTRFGTGVQTGADRLLMVEPAAAKQQSLEKSLLKPMFRGRDVRRYLLSAVPKLLIFPYKADSGKFTILSEPEVEKLKNVYALLVSNKQNLSKRIWFGKGAEELSGKWYGMMYLDSAASFAAPHILSPSLSNRSNFTLGSGDLFATGTAGVTSIIPRTDIQEDLRYLLGMLNSKAISYYAINHSPAFSGGYFKFSAPYLRKLPIRRINFAQPQEKTLHDRIVALVGQLLDLHKRLAASEDGSEHQRLQRVIDATDQQIDALVYELYGLTDEEIAIVEGGTDNS